MSEPFRIGELAAAVDVATSTVRFYERRGLLPADSRSRAGYRLYGDAAVERLRFIRLAQSSGFTLEDIAALLEFQSERSAPRERVRAMLSMRLADVRRRQSELRQLEKVIKTSLEACSRAGDGACCPVVERLTVSASGPTKKNTKRA